MSALLTKRSWLSNRPLEWTGAVASRPARRHIGGLIVATSALIPSAVLCCAVLAAAGSGLAGSGGLNPEQLHRPDALHLPAAEAGGA